MTAVSKFELNKLLTEYTRFIPSVENFDDAEFRNFVLTKKKAANFYTATERRFGRDMKAFLERRVQLAPETHRATSKVSAPVPSCLRAALLVVTGGWMTQLKDDETTVRDDLTLNLRSIGTFGSLMAYCAVSFEVTLRDQEAQLLEGKVNQVPSWESGLHALLFTFATNLLLQAVLAGIFFLHCIRQLSSVAEIRHWSELMGQHRLTPNYFLVYGSLLCFLGTVYWQWKGIEDWYWYFANAAVSLGSLLAVIMFSTTKGVRAVYKAKDGYVEKGFVLLKSMEEHFREYLKSLPSPEQMVAEDFRSAELARQRASMFAPITELRLATVVDHAARTQAARPLENEPAWEGVEMDGLDALGGQGAVPRHTKVVWLVLTGAWIRKLQCPEDRLRDVVRLEQRTLGLLSALLAVFSVSFQLVLSSDSSWVGQEGRISVPGWERRVNALIFNMSSGLLIQAVVASVFHFLAIGKLSSGAETRRWSDDMRAVQHLPFLLAFVGIWLCSAGCLHWQGHMFNELWWSVNFTAVFTVNFLIFLTTATVVVRAAYKAKSGIAPRAFAGKDDDLSAALHAYFEELGSPACFDEVGFREYLLQGFQATELGVVLEERVRILLAQERQKGGRLFSSDLEKAAAELQLVHKVAREEASAQEVAAGEMVPVQELAAVAELTTSAATAVADAIDDPGMPPPKPKSEEPKKPEEPKPKPNAVSSVKPPAAAPAKKPAPEPMPAAAAAGGAKANTSSTEGARERGDGCCHGFHFWGITGVSSLEEQTAGKSNTPKKGQAVPKDTQVVEKKGTKCCHRCRGD